MSGEKKTQQRKKFESIPLRLTRSTSSELSLKSKEGIQQKKSESRIEPRVTRSVKISSKSPRKTEYGENNQHQIANRVIRSIKPKETATKSKLEEKKNQNFDLPRVTRSQKKNTQSNSVPNLTTATIVCAEKRIVKGHSFIKLEEFELGSICLAKQKYSCPWPARVDKIEGEKILVY